MDNQSIQQLSEIVFKDRPHQIIRKKIGICNEVFELKFRTASYILRMNTEKGILYGTHKFLPLFQKMAIKTPKIIAEDYSKKQFPFCYQLLTKIEGEDLGLVINQLSPSCLQQIASEVSNIFDKFKALPAKDDFGIVMGLTEESYKSLFDLIEIQRDRILERNSLTNVIDQETLDIFHIVLSNYKDYFLEATSSLYYDDICSKNVMIHEGKFMGLVDLDFLKKGDYLEAIGRIKASWYGEKAGENYIAEIIKKQQLNKHQQKIVKVYAILNLIDWTSEEGIKFNSNSSGTIDWSKVNRKKKKIVGLFTTL